MPERKRVLTSFRGLRFGQTRLSSNPMKLFTLLLVAVAMSGVSCERHEFDGPNGTKQLNPSHSTHADHAESPEKPAH